MFSNARIRLYAPTYFALLFVLGLVVGSHFPNAFSPLVWGTLVLAAVVLMLVLRRKQFFAMSFSLLVPVALGCLLMSLDMEKMSHVPKPEYERYEAIVLSNPVRKGKTVRFDALVAGLVGKHSEPFKIKASAYVPPCDSLRLSVGDGIECFSVFTGVKTNGRSSFDYGRYLYSQGFRAQTFLYSDNIRKTNVDESRLSLLLRFRLWLMRLRSYIVRQYSENGLEGDNLAVVAALTLGDRSAVNAEVKDVYSKSGASHVLALSGLHIGIIYAMLTLLFGRGCSIGWRKMMRGFVVVATVWGYVFFVGMPVSAVRSAILLTIYNVLTMSQRSYEPLNALSFAALIILLFSPMSVYEVGFQMSFIAVASILLFYKPMYEWMLLTRLGGCLVYRWIVGMVAISLSAQIGTAPLVAFYFGRFSCYFLLSNFIAIPAAMILLYGSVALVVSIPLPAVQGVIVSGIGAVAHFMNVSLGWIASLPGASVDGIHVSVLQMVAYYVMIPCAIFLVKLVFRRRIPDYEDYVFPDS